MAVTANQLIYRQVGDKQKILVAASTRLYQGTLVFAKSDGYADDDTASGANAFLGVNIADLDNSAGSAGDVAGEVWVRGVFDLVGSGFTQADVGKDAYATDNYTITAVPQTAAGVRIGKIVEFVSSTRVRVDIDVSRPRELITAVAALGSAQGDAAPLTGVVNVVSAADGTKGVILVAGEIGQVIEVYNSVATNGLKIYPQTSGTINDGSANAAITIEGKTTAILRRTSTTNWTAIFTVNT